MRRYLTLFILFASPFRRAFPSPAARAIPAGNYCNGLGYGLKDTQLYTIDLEPQTTGISLAFGQTRQITAPTGKTCKGGDVSVVQLHATARPIISWSTLSPTGKICAGRWNRNSGGGIADFTICNRANHHAEHRRVAL